MTAATLPHRYTRTAMVLHWIIALLMVANVAMILSVDSLPDGWVRPAIDTHKSLGITVLGLVLLRLLWRLTHPAPPLPADYPRWERAFAHGAHVLLYLVMLWMPMTGWLHDSAWKDAATHPMYLFGAFEWPRLDWIASVPAKPKEMLHDVFGWMHTGGAYLLYGLVFLHVAGAFKHQFFDKEKVLRRMFS